MKARMLKITRRMKNLDVEVSSENVGQPPSAVRSGVARLV
jgi:hypothetical protein